nr:hypothetical protein GCM10020092_048160 [Actinoplanes digitatis]
MSFSLLIALLAVTADAGWWGMHTQDQVEREIAGLTVTREAVLRFMYNVGEITGWQGLVVADAGVIGGAAATAPDSYNRAGVLSTKTTIYKALDALDAAPMPADERAAAAPLREIWDGFFRTDDEIVALLRQETAPARAAALKSINEGASSDAYTDTIEITDRLQAASAARGLALRADMEDARRAGNLALAGTLAAAVLLALVAGMAVSRSIVRPLRAVMDTLARLADGDLRARVGLRRRDELGELAAAVDRSTSALQTAMRQVQSGSRRRRRRLRAAVQRRGPHGDLGRAGAPARHGGVGGGRQRAGQPAHRRRGQRRGPQRDRADGHERRRGGPGRRRGGHRRRGHRPHDRPARHLVHRDHQHRANDQRHRSARPTCWRSTPPSRRPAPASRARASRSSPAR